MKEVLPWLPADALCDIRTAEPVARELSNWSAAWLPGGSVITPPRWEKCDTPAAKTDHVSVYDGGAWRLLRREDATLDLASLLLAREVEPRDRRSAQDRALIDYLVKSSLAALTAKLDEVLAVQAPASQDWFGLPVASDRKLNLFRIEAAAPVLVMLAVGWAGPPRRTAPLPPRRSSLQFQPLRVGARIGSSRLTLAEIDALKIGDVLTLDVPVSAAIEARIDDAPAGDRALSVKPGSDCFNLQIERPAHQW